MNNQKGESGESPEDVEVVSVLRPFSPTTLLSPIQFNDFIE